MKKTLLLAVFCCLLTLVSCQKSGVIAFQGEYSFKTSGEVFVQRESTETPEIIPATFTVALPNEMGQMEIHTMDKSDDKVLVIISYMDGEIIVTEGVCDGQDIEIEEFTRNALNLSIYSYLSANCLVNIKATGHIYDGSTIVFDEVYDGNATIANVNYKIHGNKIKTVATRN